MKVKIKVEKEVNLKTLEVNAGVRYWEDSSVNGVEDDEDGGLIPCKVGNRWKPIIDIDSGIITNWEKGKYARIHYKICDDGVYTVIDEDGNSVLEKDGYVPDTMAPAERGYGDYIIMNIDENGLIEDWEFNVEDFKELDEED
jgi:hypothetical protein